MTKAIAIGGPYDGQHLDGERRLSPPNGGVYYLHWAFGHPIWVVVNDNGHTADSLAIASLIERYGQFRDFASGKTLDVINGMHDKIQELEAAAAGATAREQNFRDEIDGLKATAEQASRAMREIREFCSKVGVEDSLMSISRLVGTLAMRFESTEKALDALKKSYVDLVENIRDTLKSAGHKNEGRPLVHLVDIAIDTERTRHEESLRKIGDACGISFAIGNNYQQMADVIVNSLRSRQEKKLVAMTAAPDPYEQISEAIKKSSRMQLEPGRDGSETAVNGAHRRLDSVEARLSKLEADKSVTIHLSSGGGGGVGGGGGRKS